MNTDSFSIINPDFSKFPAIISDRFLTYEQLYKNIYQISLNLSKLKFKAGDKVALLSQDKTSLTLILLTLIHLGVIVVPINSKLPKKSIDQMLKQIDCSTIICDDSIVTENYDTTYQSICINDIAQFDTNSNADIILKPVPLSKVCSVIFTSGSSGKPKAVLHTNKNHYFSALGSNMNLPFNVGDRWLLSLPLYHVSGFSIIFRAIISGGTIVVPDENTGILENIEKNNISHVSIVPSQLLQILEDKSFKKVLKYIKAILVGGGPISSNLVEKCIKYRLPIFTTYGSTEMASQITTTKVNDKSEHFYTSGKLLKYRSIKISKNSEILVNGDTLFKGYLEDGLINKPFDSKGWFKTGDIGFINSEGHLLLTGRKDNMFISGGENIYPEEIEKYLLSIDGILDAIVIDIENTEFGARPVAFIKFQNKKIINKINIIEYLNSYLPKFKIPDAFYKWPKNISSLKPKRSEFKIFYTNSKQEEII